MQNNLKYALHGKLQAQEGKGQKLAQILLEAANLMKTAEGCCLYVVGLQAEQPDDVWITEIWDSEAAHDASLHVAGVRELIGRAIPLLKGSPEKGQSWQILGGAGLD
jgi:quinol monooxygenase YgiN